MCKIVLQILLGSHLCVCVCICVHMCVRVWLMKILTARPLIPFAPQLCGFNCMILHSVVIFRISNVLLKQNWLYILRSHHIPPSNFGQFLLMTQTNRKSEQGSPLVYSIRVSLLEHRARWRRVESESEKARWKYLHRNLLFKHSSFWFLVPCYSKYGSGISSFCWSSGSMLKIWSIGLLHRSTESKSAF